MSSETVAIGALRAHYTRPDDPGPFPGVVVLHEIWGLNDDMRRITERFAGEGYAAVAPDLFTGGGPRALCIARTVLDMAARRGRASLGHIESTRRWLADRPEVDGDRLGVIGFCMGGGFALMAGVGHTYRAVANNYGAVPKTADGLRGVCPVVASYGARDRQFTRHGRRLERVLVELGVPHDVEIYDGVGHSFLNQADHPRWLAAPWLHVGYDEARAEDAWRRILTFFAEHVRG